MRKIRPFDILIFLSIIIFLIILSLKIFKGSSGEKYLRISTHKEKLYYKLSEDMQIRVNGRLGESLIQIKDNEARFLESACRNKLCITNYAIDDYNQSIICLPNQVSISIEGKESDADSISY